MAKKARHLETSPSEPTIPPGKAITLLRIQVNYVTALQVNHSVYEYVVYESDIEKEFASSWTTERTSSSL